VSPYVKCNVAILPARLNVFSELQPRLVPPSKLARLREGAPAVTQSIEHYYNVI
jgi:hypothetical protein